MTFSLPFSRLDQDADVVLPAYQTTGAAGLDIVATAFSREGALPVTTCVLQSLDRVLVRTALALAIPEGYVGLICPRSGLALRHGITVVNAPGIIDSDFRGELGALLVNLGREPFTLERGMRVAQLVVVPVATASPLFVPALPPTARGTSGFGSTGR